MRKLLLNPFIIAVLLIGISSFFILMRLPVLYAILSVAIYVAVVHVILSSKKDILPALVVVFVMLVFVGSVITALTLASYAHSPSHCTVSGCAHKNYSEQVNR